MPDYASLLPDTRISGRPRATLTNLHEICRRTGIEVRYNEDWEREEIKTPTTEFGARSSWGWLLSECAMFDFPVSHLPRLVKVMAAANPYCPAEPHRAWNPEDVVCSMLRGELDWGAAREHWAWMSANEAVQRVWPGAMPTKSQLTKAGQLIMRFNGYRSRRTAVKRLLLVPPLLSEERRQMQGRMCA